jgi:hypothetical protein
MNTPIFREAAPAPFMTRYTGGEVQSRSATLALNLQGGSGFEIWQYTSRKTEMASFDIAAGDLGILYGKVKALDLDKAYDTVPDAEARLKLLIKTFEKEEIDFIISVGNLCHPLEKNSRIINKLKLLPFSCYFCIGNHAKDNHSVKEVRDIIDENNKNEGKVLLCINGHDHGSSIKEIKIQGVKGKYDTITPSEVGISDSCNGVSIKPDKTIAMI